MLKSLIKSLLRHRDLELKQVGSPIRGPGNFIAFLAAKDFGFSDILDVQSFDGECDISYMDIAFTRTQGAVEPRDTDLSSLSHADGAAA